MFCPQNLCSALASDDAGRHSVASGHARHDEAVSDTEVLNSIDLKFAIN
jgi:hypothetical protein